MNNNFEIVNKSKFIGVLMDGDRALYEVYLYNGHAFRLEGGRITTADEEDRRIAEKVKNILH